MAKRQGDLAISIVATVESSTHNPKFEGSYLAEGTKRDKWQKDKRTWPSALAEQFKTQLIIPSLRVLILLRALREIKWQKTKRTWPSALAQHYKTQLIILRLGVQILTMVLRDRKWQKV
jgi:hypothetical protein